MSFKAEEESSHDANNAALLEDQVTLSRQQQGWQAPGSVAASGMVASMDSGYDNDEYDELETPEREMEPSTGDGAVTVKHEPDAAPMSSLSPRPSSKNQPGGAQMHSIIPDAHAVSHGNFTGNRSLTEQRGLPGSVAEQPRFYRSVSQFAERYTPYTSEEEVKLVRLLANDSEARIWAIGERSKEPTLVWADRLNRLCTGNRSPRSVYDKLKSIRTAWKELYDKLTLRGKCSDVEAWSDQNDLACLLAAQMQHHDQWRLVMSVWHGIHVSFQRANESITHLETDTSQQSRLEPMFTPPAYEASLMRYAAQDPFLRVWAKTGSWGGVAARLKYFQQVAGGPEPEVVFSRLKQLLRMYLSLRTQLSPTGLVQRTDAWRNQADLALLNHHAEQAKWMRMYHDEIFIPDYEAFSATQEGSTSASNSVIAPKNRDGSGSSNSFPAASTPAGPHHASSVALMAATFSEPTSAVSHLNSNATETHGSVLPRSASDSTEEVRQSGSRLPPSNATNFRCDETRDIGWQNALGLREKLERQARQLFLLQEQANQQRKTLELHEELLQRHQELARQPE